MSFVNKCSKALGGLHELKFQAVLFGRDAVYLECVKPQKLDADEMIFRASGCLITLSGSGLCVIDMSDKCVGISGKVNNISVSDL